MLHSIFAAGSLKKPEFDPILLFRPRLYLMPFLFLTASVALYYYSKSLTVIPIRRNVLSLSDLKNPSLFFSSYFIWFSLQLWTYFDSFQLSLKISFFMILILFFHLDFTVKYLDPLNRSQSSRLSFFLDSCRSNFLFLLVGLCLLSWLKWFDNHIFFAAVFVFITFCLSLIFPHLCSLIVGEKTSFAGITDATRLYEGISMDNNPIVQYWAYSDFFDICLDKEPTRRNFLFSDKTDNLKEIIKKILQKINQTAENHKNLIDPDIPGVPIFLNRQPIFVKSFKQTVKNLYRTFVVAKRGNTVRMKTEKNACKDSIIVIYGMMSLERLLSIASTEDHLAIVQQFAEQILDGITNIYWATEGSSNIIWKTPPFWSSWIVKDYTQLTKKIFAFSNYVLENMTQKHGYQFDLSLMSSNTTKTIVKNFIKKSSLN